MHQHSRNDPSSLSFGRRLARAESDAAQGKGERKELMQALPGSRSSSPLRSLAGDAIKQQRKAAKRLMAGADVCLSDLSSNDTAALTPMVQEQQRLSTRDAAFSEIPMQSSEVRFPPLKHKPASKTCYSNPAPSRTVLQQIWLWQSWSRFRNGMPVSVQLLVVNGMHSSSKHSTCRIKSWPNLKQTSTCSWQSVVASTSSKT